MKILAMEVVKTKRVFVAKANAASTANLMAYDHNFNLFSGGQVTNQKTGIGCIFN